MDKESIINPDFATSTYYGKQPLTEMQLKQILDHDHLIFNVFKRKGYICSDQFSFVTKSTFGVKKNSCLEFDKTELEIDKAKKMLQIVEEYFNSLSENAITLSFAEREDNECALYDVNRLGNRIQLVLKDHFR